MNFGKDLIDMTHSHWKIIQYLTKQKEFLLCIIRFLILLEYHTFQRSSLSIKIKNELTEYLSNKLAQYTTKEYVIVYGNSLLTNVANLDEQLDNYTQEETDTGIALHAIDVTKRDPFTELVLMCSDIDVLILLLHYFEMMSSSTIFKTTEHEYILPNIHENLTPNVCKAPLGFYTLGWCDQTGKFPGYSKK